MLVFSIFCSGIIGSSMCPASMAVDSLPQPRMVRLSDSVACTAVKDQGQSPTCWVFGTHSIFESDLMLRTREPYNFSEMFVARHAYIDKARRFLATGGRTYFEGGGQFHDVIRVIREHGMVPEEVYSGRPGEKKVHDHAALDTAMKYLVHGWLREGHTTIEAPDLSRINDTLDKYLGRLPGHFTWKGKTYTARSYADELLPHPDDYVELVSFADKPLYKRFILEDKFNWASDSFWNITLKDMQQIVDTALSRGYSVGWEGDVTETGFNYFGGYAALPDSAYAYDRQRLLNYQTEATERDHMLHLAGTGRDPAGRKWYYLKNSWGTWLSPYKGYIYMEENYFRMKTVILFVHKNGLPVSIRNKLGNL